MELVLVSGFFRRQTETPWLPVRWGPVGLLGLVGALACNAVGGALLQWKAPHWHAPTSVLSFVGGGLLAPITEEWIFRGVLWKLASETLQGTKWAPLVAGVFTSLLFGLWHLPFAGHSAIWANVLFGAFLAIARWRLGGIAPGVIVHWMGNSFFLLTG
jgi:membrane protease YdiL (CAAX protease family)